MFDREERPCARYRFSAGVRNSAGVLEKRLKGGQEFAGLILILLVDRPVFAIYTLLTRLTTTAAISRVGAVRIVRAGGAGNDTGAVLEAARLAAKIAMVGYVTLPRAT